MGSESPVTGSSNKTTLLHTILDVAEIPDFGGLTDLGDL
jgi:hypothetical protein